MCQYDKFRHLDEVWWTVKQNLECGMTCGVTRHDLQCDWRCDLWCDTVSHTGGQTVTWCEKWRNTWCDIVGYSLACSGIRGVTHGVTLCGTLLDTHRLRCYTQWTALMLYSIHYNLVLALLSVEGLGNLIVDCHPSPLPQMLSCRLMKAWAARVTGKEEVLLTKQHHLMEKRRHCTYRLFLHY